MRTLLLLLILFLLGCTDDATDTQPLHVSFCAEYVCLASASAETPNLFIPDVVDFCCFYNDSSVFCIEDIQEGIPNVPQWHAHRHPCDNFW